MFFFLKAFLEGEIRKKKKSPEKMRKLRILPKTGGEKK